MNNVPAGVLEAATHLGWRFFPAERSGKKPLISAWQVNASCDPAQLEKWAQLFPVCNWGLATGAPGVFVVDIDGEAGRNSESALRDEGIALPTTLTVTTGRQDGGEHRYYLVPDGATVKNSSGKLGDGIDVRGAGGYVIFPPSVHSSGRTYQFVDQAAPVVIAPPELIERLTLKPHCSPVAQEEQADPIGPGKRTPLLVSLAGKLHSMGTPASSIEAALLGLNSTFAPPHAEEKVRKIVEDIMSRYPAGSMPVTNNPRPDIVCLADVEPRPVDWLWEPYVALGMLTIVEGDPGAGKTFLVLSLAAGITRGQTPEGNSCTAGNVLYLSVENPPAEVLRPRFDALGGDPLRFQHLRGSKWQENGEDVFGAVSLADVSLLDEAISTTQARLVVVDPLQSYLGAGVDFYRSNETRPVFDALAKLAEKYHCAVILVRHTTKQTGGKAIHRGNGGIDMIGVARSAMLAGALPDDPKCRALVHIKSNIGPFGPALGYVIGDDGSFAWTGKSDVTAEELSAAPSRGDSALRKAQDWLKEFLAAGPRAQKDCVDVAGQSGIAAATLRRGKDALHVESYRPIGSKVWMWRLPEPEGTPSKHGPGNLLFMKPEHAIEVQQDDQPEEHDQDAHLDHDEHLTPEPDTEDGLRI